MSRPFSELELKKLTSQVTQLVILLFEVYLCINIFLRTNIAAIRVASVFLACFFLAFLIFSVIFVLKIVKRRENTDKLEKVYIIFLILQNALILIFCVAAYIVTRYFIVLAFAAVVILSSVFAILSSKKK